MSIPTTCSSCSCHTSEPRSKDDEEEDKRPWFVQPPDPYLVATFSDHNLTSISSSPPLALDLACGFGRHAMWLNSLGYKCTAVDKIVDNIFLSKHGITHISADLEAGRDSKKSSLPVEYVIEQNHWNLIVCWLYWQPSLIEEIKAGIKPGGIVCLAGLTHGIRVYI